jgi:Ca-activated chloride channel family protein
MATRGRSPNFGVVTDQLIRRARHLRDRRPLLIAAVYVLVLTSGLGVWPHALQTLCPSILIASSNEKAQLMTQLAAEYSATHSGWWSGCGPVVTVEDVASGDAERQLEGGWPGAGRPDVWSPAATTWVRLLQAGSGTRLVPGDQWLSIATSPLVIAVAHQMAEALRWSDRPPTWTQLFRLAQDPRGWGVVGHPDWGPFRLGMTDPRTSTSGLHTLITLYMAATGASDLTKGAVNAPAAEAFVAGVEASVSHYASTAGIFLDSIAAADSPRFISAVPVEEQEVFNYNEGLHSPERPKVAPVDWLDAVIPAGQTILADHPFVILNAPWVDGAKVAIATQFLNWLRSADQQRRFSEAGFRDDADVAESPLKDEVGISGYRPDSPPPPRGDAIQAVRDSWGAVRKPARVVIVLDGAGPSVRAEAITSLDELRSTDQVAVWAVGSLQPILDPTSLDEAGRTSVRQAIDSVPSSGASERLYDTVWSAYEALAHAPGAGYVNAIVIISSHKDDGSDIRLSVLERHIQAPVNATATRIYGVAMSGSDPTALVGIEKASGGVPRLWTDAASAVGACLGNF